MMININNKASENLQTQKKWKYSKPSKNIENKEKQFKKRPKLKKRKRLIIRNLSFKVTENDLKEIFSAYGKVVDVKIPLKEDGKKRGFAFIEFDDTKSLIQAMKTMNYKEIHGRKVAIDYAVDKTSYKLKLQGLNKEKSSSSGTKIELKEESDSDVEIKSEKDSDLDENEVKNEDSESEEDEDEKRLNAFLKEFDSGAETLTNPHIDDDKSSSSESSSEESDADEEGEESYCKKEKGSHKKDEIIDKKEKAIVKKSNDVLQQKTVFIRNLSFMTTEEALEDEISNFGECEYCVLVRDQLTEHPKGSAFVKFKTKESAEKLVEQSETEKGLTIDGRRLSCVIAVSKEAIPSGKPLEKTDKRNLNLVRVGIITPEEANGMSKADQAKRNQLELFKKAKLKNVNLFVSDKRLLVHNLPQMYTDNNLRQLFKKAVPGSVITEARVMKEFRKVNSEGVPLSKGFGFVCFEKHEDAMKALEELNNNPSIFTSQKRPIVEFSVENKMALLSKERRKEKIQMRNKRRTEEKNERKLKQDSENKTQPPSQKGKRQKSKKKQVTENKKRKFEATDIPKDNSEKSPRKKQRKPRTRKGQKNQGTFNESSFSEMKKKYTNILSNQISV